MLAWVDAGPPAIDESGLAVGRGSIANRFAGPCDFPAAAGSSVPSDHHARVRRSEWLPAAWARNGSRVVERVLAEQSLALVWVDRNEARNHRTRRRCLGHG